MAIVKIGVVSSDSVLLSVHVESHILPFYLTKVGAEVKVVAGPDPLSEKQGLELRVSFFGADLEINDGHGAETGIGVGAEEAGDPLVFQAKREGSEEHE